MMSASGHCPVGKIWMTLSCVSDMSETCWQHAQLSSLDPQPLIHCCYQLLVGCCVSPSFGGTEHIYSITFWCSIHHSKWQANVLPTCSTPLAPFLNTAPFCQCHCLLSVGWFVHTERQPPKAWAPSLLLFCGDGLYFGFPRREQAMVITSLPHRMPSTDHGKSWHQDLGWWWMLPWWEMAKPINCLAVLAYLSSLLFVCCVFVVIGWQIEVLVCSISSSV